MFLTDVYQKFLAWQYTETGHRAEDTSGKSDDTYKPI